MCLQKTFKNLQKPDFQKATAMLENLISVNSDEDGCFIVRTGKTGKYGRWLITIQGVNDVLASIWPYDK